MAEDRFEEVKKLTIISLVSDDRLMERLVLKGGNAIKLVGPQAARKSLDLDFSLDGELGDINEARSLAERLLSETFAGAGLNVFDVRLEKAPPNVGIDTIGDFWGGYTLQFKVMPREQYDRLSGRPQKRQIQALELGPGGKRTFTVDISGHEYCEGKVACDVEGFTVYVYTPLMIACEKVRALCQQMPQYRAVVKSQSARPRARDFFDIHYLVTTLGVSFDSVTAWETLHGMFRVKHVPLRLLSRISAEREFHRENFASVKDTVAAGHPLREFDYYVEFLVEQLRPLQTRWEEDAPAV